MNQLQQLLNTYETQIADFARKKAAELGFPHHTKSAGKPWDTTVSLISKAIVQALKTHGDSGCELSPDALSSDDPLSGFAIRTARQHREHGITLAMFMGMFKFYRMAYVDIIQQHVDDVESREQSVHFVNQVFDALEVAQCVDWAQVEEQERFQELEQAHQAALDENERFQAFINSIASPAFLLDAEHCVEILNPAAASLLENEEIRQELEYAKPITGSRDKKKTQDKIPLAEVLPWLSEAIHEACSFGPDFNECRFDTSYEVEGKTSHYSIAVSVLRDSLDTFTGLTVVVDEITSRAEAEKQLAHERNLAANYLDVVGTIVVALDPSGNIMLINKTGCDILGYEADEIIGQNWFDLSIPDENTDEIKDYFYHIFAENIELDDQHVNYVATQWGDQRLISWNNRLLRNDAGIPIGVLSSGMDITEQQEAEEALAEKEIWLRNTFVALGETVLILTPDRSILDANPAAEIMFQMTNEELTESPIDTVHVSEESSKEYAEITRAAFKRGETANFEFELKRKDGEIFPTENSVSLISNDEGKPLGVVNVIRDISNRKRAEQVLLRSEEKFRRIFETIEEGFLVTNMQGIIQMVNPATCNLMGYKESDLLGKPMNSLYAGPEERNKLQGELAAKGKIHGMHLSAVRKDGSTIVVETNAHYVKDENGNPIAMEGTFRDITARLEAEQVIREREKQYRAFFENNHAIMLLEDPKTSDIVDANPAAAEFYGYSVEEMREMNMNQISALSEEEIYKEMFSARDENRVYFIFKHRQASGEIRDVEVYSGPIMVRGNQLLYSVIHDVTARIELESDMKRMATTDALTGVNNRHQFFLLAGQELKRSQRYKNPLAVIMLDIDYFKSINDTHGHQTGDVVLRALAAMATATLRDSDIFGRLGGEEFAAILPETEIMAAMQVADRLRIELSKLTIRANDTDINFTVSIGVSIANAKDKIIEDVLSRADEALYRAKRGGRNKVERN